MGCLCHMPVKAMDPDADCWLYERLGSNETGWPDELNGTYATRSTTSTTSETASDI